MKLCYKNGPKLIYNLNYIFNVICKNFSLFFVVMGRADFVSNGVFTSVSAQIEGVIAAQAAIIQAH